MLAVSRTNNPVLKERWIGVSVAVLAVGSMILGLGEDFPWYLLLSPKFLLFGPRHHQCYNGTENTWFLTGFFSITWDLTTGHHHHWYSHSACLGGSREFTIFTMTYTFAAITATGRLFMLNYSYNQVDPLTGLHWLPSVFFSITLIIPT